VINDLLESDRKAAVPTQKDDKLTMAVISPNEIIGTLSEDESKGLCWLWGNVKDIYLPIEYDENKGEYTCADMNTIFGDKDNPESIRYIINQILGYIRIIVPILIILLGTLDFAKAVLAGKEDNMKKAQSTFVKRLIAGVAVFFVPVIVDIIMDLADIVWAGEYTHCDF